MPFASTPLRPFLRPPYPSPRTFCISTVALRPRCFLPRLLTFFFLLLYAQPALAGITCVVLYGQLCYNMHTTVRYGYYLLGLFFC